MMRYRRGVLLVAALLATAYVVLSVRRLDSPGRHLVIDIPILATAPRLVSPGWRFVPRLLGRVSSYPAGAARLRVDLRGAQAATTREGERVEVEIDLTYGIDPGRVLDLHRARGPGYESAWLAALTRDAAAAGLGALPYDALRRRDPELARSVRTAIDGETGKEGVRLTGLRVVPIAAAGESAGAILRAGAEPLERRVVLIGVDSFDWRMIDPLIEQGRMPNMARLVARGARAHLRTIRPILSPVIWTSIATGVRPSRHGIADFVVTSRDTGALVPVTSAMRQVPALWTLMGRQGVEVSVVAWWATWPAETVRGSMVTDRVAYQLFRQSIGDDWRSADPARHRGKTYPPELFDALRPLIRLPAEVQDEEVARFLPGGAFPRTPAAEQRDLLNEFRTVIAAGETYHAIALRLLDPPGPRLAMIYYEGPDTASHLFMRYRPPRLEGVEPRDVDLFGGIVDRYYERQDRFIGEIVEAAGEGATIVLVSDHGFKSDANRPPHSDPRIGKADAAAWHTPVGVLVLAGPDIGAGVDLGAASVLDVTPTILALYGLPAARDMDGQPLVEAFTEAFRARRPAEWIETYGGIRPDGQDAGPVASSGDAEVLEKLRSLGYIGDDRLTAHNNRGIMALDEGDVDGAIADFERALVSDGGQASPMIQVNLAGALLRKGELERARALAEEALAKEPRNKGALLVLAREALRRGDPGDSERHLRRALDIDPTLAPAWSELGKLLQQRGDDDAALAAYGKAIAIAPLSPFEYNEIGNIHRERGRVERAIASYREALRCDAAYVGAYNNLGLLLQGRGRLDESRALYEKALAIRPENPVLRNSLGTLLAARGDREGAIDEFRRAVKADPGWGVAQGNLATVLFESGRPDEALGAFERWVTLEPEAVDARLGLAASLLMARRTAGALDQLGEVLRRDPGNLKAHIALGETLMRDGDLERARRHLEQAARIDPSIPRIHNNLGAIYLKHGLRREAAGAFRKSLRLDPRQEEIRRRLAEAGG